MTSCTYNYLEHTTKRCVRRGTAPIQVLFMEYVGEDGVRDTCDGVTHYYPTSWTSHSTGR